MTSRLAFGFGRTIATFSRGCRSADIDRVEALPATNAVLGCVLQRRQNSNDAKHFGAAICSAGRRR